MPDSQMGGACVWGSQYNLIVVFVTGSLGLEAPTCAIEAFFPD